MTAHRHGLPEGLERVAVRQLLLEAPVIRFPLHAGDRPLIAVGDVLAAGAPVFERVRAPQVVSIPASAVDPNARPGDWWEDDGSRHGVRRSRVGVEAAELLYRASGAWEAVAGEGSEIVESPVAGIVREVRPGIGILVATGLVGITGVAAVGGQAGGRLEIVARGDGELRGGGLDIARSGAIIAAGSRVDAEMLTRARATGVRGVIAGAIGTRELRDLQASEGRQRQSLQPFAPFAVLALEGHVKTPIPSPVMAILAAIAGREAAIVGEPPALLFEKPDAALPVPDPDFVVVRHGPAAGREGRWLGLAGRRRFESGVLLDAGLVDLGDGPPLLVPLVDLQRFA